MHRNKKGVGVGWGWGIWETETYRNDWQSSNIGCGNTDKMCIRTVLSTINVKLLFVQGIEKKDQDIQFGQNK
jgi:hypothetical protein